MKIKITDAGDYKIQAIKIVRFLTSSDLKTAKDAVDDALVVNMDENFNEPSAVRDVFIANNLKTDFDIVNDTIHVSILGSLHQQSGTKTEQIKNTPKVEEKPIAKAAEILQSIATEQTKKTEPQHTAPRTEFYNIKEENKQRAEDKRHKAEDKAYASRVTTYIHLQNPKEAVSVGVTTAVLLALAWSAFNWFVFNTSLFVYALTIALGISYFMRKKGRMVDVKYGFKALKYYLLATYAVFFVSVLRYSIYSDTEISGLLNEIFFGIFDNGNWLALLAGAFVAIFNAYRTVPKDIRDEVLKLHRENEQRSQVQRKGIIGLSSNSENRKPGIISKNSNKINLPRYLQAESKEIDERKRARRDEYERIKTKHRESENEKLSNNRFNKSGEPIKF